MSEGVLDKSRFTTKVGTYAVGPGTAIRDTLILQKVQGYRRATGAMMQALDKISMRKRIPESDYFISRKIDGEFNVMVYRDGDIFLVNPGGTVRIGLPLLAEAKKALDKAGADEVMICGELHVVRPDGKRPRIHDVVRVARKPESAEQTEQLHFAIFDMLTPPGEEPETVYANTWNWITKTFKGGTLVQPVETVQGPLSEIYERFAEWVEKEGSEGVVARSDAAGRHKIKPRHSIDAAVIGFAEGIDDRKGMLHDLLLAIVRPDGSFHIMGRTGGGFSDEQRVQYLADLQDMVVDSEYHEINSDHVAYQMVRPEWVVEIAALDFITTSTRGVPVRRMVIEWDAKANAWKTLRRLPLVSIISPIFRRIRTDKKPDEHDARLAQLTAIVEIEQAEATAEDLALPKSTLMRREVRVKSISGKSMVRKLVMWKTNKETVSDEYPAYVIYYTDFSSGRADPLDREIRVTNDRGQLDELWDAFEAKAFKKGWKPPEEEE